MKKIFVDRDEEIAPLVERIISDEDEELVLVIPRNTVLKESIGNFRILKREAEEAGKNILIESVDADVLALATKVKIDSFHPLFQDAKSRSLSDIRPQGETKSSARAGASSAGRVAAMSGPAAPIKKGGSRGKAKVSEEEEEPVRIEASPVSPSVPAAVPTIPEQLRAIKERDKEEEAAFAAKESEFAVKAQSAVAGLKEQTERFHLSVPSISKVRLGWKGIVVILGVVIIFGAGVWAVNRYFGKANIEISFKTTPWQNQVHVTASKSVSKAANNGAILPAEYLTQTKNTTQFFPATGKAVVSIKAAGRITIYNGYSSQSQTLVATTRFETPDGKIFRIDKTVTVPGAQIKDGKISPSSVDADITADQPGSAYNLGPVSKLTIPGLKGTPKFDGFYGEIKDKTSGGATGERPVPTESDIANSKDKTSDILRKTLEDNLTSGRPDDFTILPGASDITITRLLVNKTTDDKGQFSVFGEAQYRAVAFRENDLRNSLLGAASQGKNYLAFRKADISYKDTSVDLTKGEVNFTAVTDAVLAPAFSEQDFVSNIRGKDIGVARADIGNLPDLDSGRIAMWPFWLKTIPGDAGRIKITVR